MTKSATPAGYADGRITGSRVGELPERTLRSTDDTPCDLDICDMSALKGEHQRCEDNPDRKATPMLPEPTLPKRRAASLASPEPWVMTPLFAGPDGDQPDVPRPPGHRTARPPTRGRRPSSRRPAGRAK